MNVRAVPKTVAVRVMAVVAIAMALVAGTNLVRPPAASAAVTCYGDYCSGQDPMATHCSDDGRTVAATDVYYRPFVSQTARYAGYLELRWSPTCKTNWARFTPQAGFNYRLQAVQPETGYTQTQNANSWQSAWTSQIYSPAKCVYAYILVVDYWSDGNGKTACI